MGRKTEGWTLRQHRITKIWHVRFTHAGRTVELSTGERVQQKAKEKAGPKYAAFICGRRRREGVKCSAGLLALTSAWLADVDAELDPSTVELYLLYSSRWITFFETLDGITAPSAEDYRRARLRKVCRATVQKELAALRGFLRWCAGGGYLAEAPAVAPVPRGAIGERRYERKAILLERAEVERLLAVLPEWSSSRKHAAAAYPVRARFILSWEVPLRPETISRLSVPENYTRGSSHLVLTGGDEKQRGSRDVPLTPRARAALDSVAPDVGVIFGKHDYRNILRARAEKKAELAPERAKRITAHCFRHSGLTDLLDNGASLTGVQALADHKHVSTTARYIRSSYRAAEEALRVGR